MLKVSDIINNTKKEFTRDRASVINDFLKDNGDNTVVISFINKDRGESIKFYYIEDGKKLTNDYIVKNAKIIINNLIKDGKKIYLHNNGKITPYEL